jgi:N-formylglutamate amidohydrolase
METLKTYDPEELREDLYSGLFPIHGISSLGSAEFHLRAPAHYLGVALHSGGRVREELVGVMAVTPEERFREEDPFTELFIQDFPLQLIGRDSRFEYDLNREPDRCIYAHNRKKWGLTVWNRELTQKEKELNLTRFREFHVILDMLVEYVTGIGTPAVLFDMHSFCYQRKKKMLWFEDAGPEINLGTRFINREYFAPLVDRFLEGISGMMIDGYPVRVRENVLFPGGYLTRKYAASHNREILVLAIEFKKLFMDEVTGIFNSEKFHILKSGFTRSKDRILER